MAKRDLYKISGHWDHYRDGMFIMGDENDEEAEVFALRPMTCPFQFQVYLAHMRSYRELPMRLNKPPTLFRNELPRDARADPCPPVYHFGRTHRLHARTAEQSLPAAWSLRSICSKTSTGWMFSYRFSSGMKTTRKNTLAPRKNGKRSEPHERDSQPPEDFLYRGCGEAAFYGPKLDIQIKNVHGKEDTMITVQSIFSLQNASVWNMSTGTDRKNSLCHSQNLHRLLRKNPSLLLEKLRGSAADLDCSDTGQTAADRRFPAGIRTECGKPAARFRYAC
jgi:threonyl-tRNA synthetase